jgi:hypothetical protein
MALRGKQPVEFLPNQKEVWRTFILVSALGYWKSDEVRAEVARRLGLQIHVVYRILNDTKPMGCFS